MPLKHSASAAIFEANRKFIPGGVVSINRAVQPEIAFVKGRGSRVWDADGNEYLDYHAAFAPYVLGHNDPDVNAAVRRALDDEVSMMGSGTNPWEGQAAASIVNNVSSVHSVMLTNTGSEATYHAIRIARSHTGRNGIIVMQGGYNGWHNDVAVNVMTPLDIIGPRVCPGEYRVAPITAGIPDHVLQDIHVVNYNDLDSIRYVFQRHKIAAVLLEPILQNIGIVKPQPGYLEGLRELCNEAGVVLIFDEVKTGFRHALGGYQSICKVQPDLSVFGKALANGYPMGAIGGSSELMGYFTHPDASRRVLIAGTYNAHPIPCAAAIATITKLSQNNAQAYTTLYALGEQMQTGLETLFNEFGITATICRQGSAFCAYFMDHAPADWHDIALHHNFDLDTRYRTALLQRGIYHFPLPTKQGSISLAHTTQDIDLTLERTREVLKTL
ncbi:MAG: aminotransferase class III-fold pyridoxal phosphate-dependent enzyme [bacterium]|nr:aminotransferase class III-fold pyridoxal phosphate-dependent enzyme [bacterium]